jgi:hypothetical protein
MSHPLTACISEIGFLQERIAKKNARIEALEAALREILDPPSTLDEPERDIDLILQMRAIARAALAPEQDK